MVYRIRQELEQAHNKDTGGTECRWLLHPHQKFFRDGWTQQCKAYILGVYTVADNILVIGKGATDTDARKDHDDTLITLLNRCKEKAYY